MELEHKYGPRVHLLNDPYLLSLLARLGSPITGTEAVTALVRSAYRRLCAEVLAREFPVVHDRVKTRMAATEPRAFYEGPRLCRNTKLVVCAVIRAGILPAQVCYETACEVVPPSHVRLVYRPFFDLDAYCAEHERLVRADTPPFFLEAQVFAQDFDRMAAERWSRATGSTVVP